MNDKINNHFSLNSTNFFSRMKIIFQARESIVILLVVIFILIVNFLAPGFLTYNNFKAIGITVSMEAPVAAVMGVLLIVGCFDLSVGTVSALGGVVTGIFLKNGHNITLSIILGLMAGSIIGIFNGVLVTKLKINALIATLSTMTIARGITLLISKGRIQTNFPEAFAFLGRGQIFNVFISTWIALIIVIISDLSIRKMRALRQIYYVGRNEKAAIYSGIKVDKIRMIALATSGLFSALCGIMISSRVLSASSLINQDLPLRVIAAAIIGGCTLSGGEGSVAGSVLGLIFMYLVYNAMVLLRISVFWQGIVVGIILAAAVSIDSLTRRKR